MKVYKYGANVDTDVIIPARHLNDPSPAALASHCMEDIDAAFASTVEAGDIVVGGTNFGCGSSREHAPLAIKSCGVKCVIAKSFARIFYRNAINIGFPILESDGIAGINLFEYNKKHPNGVLMCTVIRDGEAIVPNGRFVPQVGDKAYMVGSQREIVKFFHTIGRDGNRIRQITVLGGSKIATYLAWAVEKVGMKVRIVEQDPEKCEALSDKLPDSLIIWGDGTDSAVIDGEGLLDTDAFIALTNRDEENLLMAMTAQRHGVKKVIAKMSRPNYIDMMRESGVDSIISPKDITANQISAYVRAMARSEGSAVENVYKPLGGAVEAVEFTATATAKFLDTPLAELGRRLKPGILVAAIAREGKTIIPDGSTSIRAGDKVIIMAKSLFLQELDEILQDP